MPGSGIALKARKSTLDPNPNLHKQKHRHGPEAQRIHRVPGGLEQIEGADMLSGELQGRLQGSFDIIGAGAFLQLPDSHVHRKINLQFFPALLTGINMF